ncbi:hypothetical protein RFN31_32775 [Mesorhizobium sp. VK3C]|nr:hypothetical protein [Mesorhizobium sp. VK3C]
MKGKSDRQAAALEAKQEAGVTGKIEPAPVGTYQYWKRLENAFVPITVTVYALRSRPNCPVGKNEVSV